MKDLLIVCLLTFFTLIIIFGVIQFTEPTGNDILIIEKVTSKIDDNFYYYKAKFTNERGLNLNFKSKILYSVGDTVYLKQ